MVDSDSASKPTSPAPEPTEAPSNRRPSVASRISYKARSMSKEFEESNPPVGFMAATSQFASSAIVGDVPRRNTGQSAEFKSEEKAAEEKTNPTVASSSAQHNRPVSRDSNGVPGKEISHDTTADTAPYANGYHFPPSYPKGEAFKHGLMAFLRYSITPMGFFVVLYGLNVVAWGGMLFLLLCNASPAMCSPDCNDIDSPRRVWIEYDSQVLTALFSLTAFGLAPWRFRDLYYLMKYRLGNQDALRRLAGIHRDWFRLPGSATLPVDVGPENVDDVLGGGDIPLAAVPEPAKKISEAPLTGVRAPPTKVWKMDFMIWNMVWNTLFQCVLSGFMWGMNRYDRPSWSTGLFVALGCIVAAIGGLTMFVEGRHVKAIEGVPLTDRDRAKLARDQAEGVFHYNNLKDKPIKEKAKHKKADKDVEKAESHEESHS